MSEFRGFRCNRCGEIIAIEDRVKEVVKFIGPDGEEGSYYRDLCAHTCAPAVRGEMQEQHYLPTPTRAKRRRLHRPSSESSDSPSALVASAS